MPDYLDEFMQDFFYLWDKNLLFVMFLCGSVVEHCISSAKDCGTYYLHLLMKMYNLNVNVSRFG